MAKNVILYMWLVYTNHMHFIYGLVLNNFVCVSGEEREKTDRSLIQDICIPDGV